MATATRRAKTFRRLGGSIGAKLDRTATRTRKHIRNYRETVTGHKKRAWRNKSESHAMKVNDRVARQQGWTSGGKDVEGTHVWKPNGQPYPVIADRSDAEVAKDIVSLKKAQGWGDNPTGDYTRYTQGGVSVAVPIDAKARRQIQKANYATNQFHNEASRQKKYIAGTVVAGGLALAGAGEGARRAYNKRQEKRKGRKITYRRKYDKKGQKIYYDHSPDTIDFTLRSRIGGGIRRVGRGIGRAPGQYFDNVSGFRVHRAARKRDTARRLYKRHSKYDYDANGARSGYAMALDGAEDEYAKAMLRRKQYRIGTGIAGTAAVGGIVYNTHRQNKAKKERERIYGYSYSPNTVEFSLDKETVDFGRLKRWKKNAIRLAKKAHAGGKVGLAEVGAKKAVTTASRVAHSPKAWAKGGKALYDEGMGYATGAARAVSGSNPKTLREGITDGILAADINPFAGMSRKQKARVARDTFMIGAGGVGAYGLTRGNTYEDKYTHKRKQDKIRRREMRRERLREERRKERKLRRQSKRRMNQNVEFGVPTARRARNISRVAGDIFTKSGKRIRHGSREYWEALKGTRMRKSTSEANKAFHKYDYRRRATHTNGLADQDELRVMREELKNLNKRAAKDVGAHALAVGGTAGAIGTGGYVAHQHRKKKRSEMNYSYEPDTVDFIRLPRSVQKQIAKRLQKAGKFGGRQLRKARVVGRRKLRPLVKRADKHIDRGLAYGRRQVNKARTSALADRLRGGGTTAVTKARRVANRAGTTTTTQSRRAAEALTTRRVPGPAPQGGVPPRITRPSITQARNRATGLYGQAQVGAARAGSYANKARSRAWNAGNRAGAYFRNNPRAAQAAMVGAGVVGAAASYAGGRVMHNHYQNARDKKQARRGEHNQYQRAYWDAPIETVDFGNRTARWVVKKARNPRGRLVRKKNKGPARWEYDESMKQRVGRYGTKAKQWSKSNLSRASLSRRAREAPQQYRAMARNDRMGDLQQQAKVAKGHMSELKKAMRSGEMSDEALQSAAKSYDRWQQQIRAPKIARAKQIGALGAPVAAVGAAGVGVGYAAGSRKKKKRQEYSGDTFLVNLDAFLDEAIEAQEEALEIGFSRPRDNAGRFVSGAPQASPKTMEQAYGRREKNLDGRDRSLFGMF